LTTPPLIDRDVARGAHGAGIDVDLDDGDGRLTATKFGGS
jgi:hypothetical protein